MSVDRGKSLFMKNEFFFYGLVRPKTDVKKNEKPPQFLLDPLSVS